MILYLFFSSMRFQCSSQELSNKFKISLPCTLNLGGRDMDVKLNYAKFSQDFKIFLSSISYADYLGIVQIKSILNPICKLSQRCPDRERKAKFWQDFKIFTSSIPYANYLDVIQMDSVLDPIYRLSQCCLDRKRSRSHILTISVLSR